jgi:hypothetical protein
MPASTLLSLIWRSAALLCLNNPALVFISWQSLFIFPRKVPNNLILRLNFGI